MVTINPLITTSSPTAQKLYLHLETQLHFPGTSERNQRLYLEPDMDLYADLHGMRAHETSLSTIHETIHVTSPHPDVVIIEQKEVTHIELTISHNSAESMTMY